MQRKVSKSTRRSPGLRHALATLLSRRTGTDRSMLEKRNGSQHSSQIVRSQDSNFCISYHCHTGRVHSFLSFPYRKDCNKEPTGALRTLTANARAQRREPVTGNRKAAMTPTTTAKPQRREEYSLIIIKKHSASPRLRGYRSASPRLRGYRSASPRPRGIVTKAP